MQFTQHHPIALAAQHFQTARFNDIGHIRDITLAKHQRSGIVALPQHGGAPLPHAAIRSGLIGQFPLQLIQCLHRRQKRLFGHRQGLLGTRLLTQHVV